MKHFKTLLLILAASLMLVACGSGGGGGSDSGSSGVLGEDCVDVSGTYSMKITPTSHNCGDTPPNEYDTVKVVQTECNIRLTYLDGSTSSGSVSGNTASGTKSWDEDYGRVTLKYSVSLSGSSVSGSGTWTYTEDGYSCNGNASIKNY